MLLMLLVLKVEVLIFLKVGSPASVFVYQYFRAFFSYLFIIYVCVSLIEMARLIDD